MVKIKEAILVEGRYDKNTLSQIVDAPILETSGFGIFKDKQQMNLLRRVAETLLERNGERRARDEERGDRDVCFVE